MPPDTAPGTSACVVVTWTADPGPSTPRTERVCATVVGPDGTGQPTPTPRPAPTPTVAPTTPCWAAAQAALSTQGALYSQGGALAGDPINPRTGRPYPRTGPNSFDCSGLIWWAYQQAGITVGTSTYTQIADGHALPCTLDDLQGDATRCWAPGDLIFLRYPGGAARGHVCGEWPVYGLLQPYHRLCPARCQPGPLLSQPLLAGAPHRVRL
ncbi:MAG: C40 family peptidase [Blastochloris sp.]|nr:C40 family peptidase [Blastochloris sp.]